MVPIRQSIEGRPSFPSDSPEERAHLVRLLWAAALGNAATLTAVITILAAGALAHAWGFEVPNWHGRFFYLLIMLAFVPVSWPGYGIGFIALLASHALCRQRVPSALVWALLAYCGPMAMVAFAGPLAYGVRGAIPWSMCMLAGCSVVAIVAPAWYAASAVWLPWARRGPVWVTLLLVGGVPMAMFVGATALSFVRVVTERYVR
jgi:hypothetical protein